MSRVYFQSELEGVATFWRILRRDGVALGFTAHDRDLWFEGVLHRAAPGMSPTAIRRVSSLRADSAEVAGALCHDGISAVDLAAGRFDGAQIAIGMVDWETLDAAILYRGEIGGISEESATFSAELLSAKSALSVDLVPRTSPTCRAQFCGPGCTLNPEFFTWEARVAASDPDTCRIELAGGPDPALLVHGTLRWLDGTQAGLSSEITASDAPAIMLDLPPDPALVAGARVLLREGCDHTHATCSARFGNGANFQGEPFLPGNDILARYPAPPQ